MLEKIKNKKYLSGAMLKWIAIITMLIDHIGAVVIEGLMRLPQYGGIMGKLYTTNLILRNIGRIAFPIFCFLIVEGFFHTRNVKKYAIRLFIFALISEIPFNLANTGHIFFPQAQNVFFTLFIGLITIWALDNAIKLMKEKGKVKIILAVLSIIAAGMFIAYLLKTDYSYIGVFLIILFYINRNDRASQCIIGAITFIWEPASIVAFILIYFYNGQRGKQINKYVFYAFYPVHLTILYGILMLITK